MASKGKGRSGKASKDRMAPASATSKADGLAGAPATKPTKATAPPLQVAGPPDQAADEPFAKLSVLGQHPLLKLLVGGIGFVAVLLSIFTYFGWMPHQESDPPVRASTTALRAASIHVGQPAANLDEIFGAPIKSAPVAGDQGWTQNTYIKQDVASTVVIDADGQIVLYSLLSCMPDANLKVTTSSGTTVTLQGPSIAKAESAPDANFDPNNRDLSYLEGGTGSSLGQLLERSVDGVRSGNGWRSYIVGINRACGETNFAAVGDSGGLKYFGALSDAPNALRTFRETIPANSYTEISEDFMIMDDTTIIWRGVEGEQGPAYASPDVNVLPREFTEQYWAGK